MPHREISRRNKMFLKTGKARHMSGFLLNYEIPGGWLVLPAAALAVAEGELDLQAGDFILLVDARRKILQRDGFSIGGEYFFSHISFCSNFENDLAL